MNFDHTIDFAEILGGKQRQAIESAPGGLVRIDSWRVRHRPTTRGRERGPRSGPHQRRGFAERVAPLSHLWTARHSYHGRPGALPTGLTALMPAHGLLRTDFIFGIRNRKGFLANLRSWPRTPGGGSMDRSTSWYSTGELHRQPDAKPSREHGLQADPSSSLPPDKREQSPARSLRAGIGPVGGGVRPVSCRAGPAAMTAARRSRAEPPSTGSMRSPDALSLPRVDLARCGRSDGSRRPGTPAGRAVPLTCVAPLPPRASPRTWLERDVAVSDAGSRECPDALCGRSSRREHPLTPLRGSS
jgi:hypothetical protein